VSRAVDMTHRTRTELGFHEIPIFDEGPQHAIFGLQGSCSSERRVSRSATPGPVATRPGEATYR
jgi:hypothetical protein